MKEPELVDVPESKFLMIDGAGSPESPDYRLAIGALYSLAYPIRFALKRSGVDEKVMPLEGLWWADDRFDAAPRAEWRWTALIRVPDAVTPELFERLRAEAAAKHPELPFAAVRRETWREGESAQVMHIGPYSAEGPTIERLHAFIGAHARKPRGKHHEIYLGDPRRAKPETLRTLIRQPVAAAP